MIPKNKKPEDQVPVELDWTEEEEEAFNELERKKQDGDL